MAAHAHLPGLRPGPEKGVFARRTLVKWRSLSKGRGLSNGTERTSRYGCHECSGLTRDALAPGEHRGQGSHAVTFSSSEKDRRTCVHADRLTTRTAGQAWRAEGVCGAWPRGARGLSHSVALFRPPESLSKWAFGARCWAHGPAPAPRAGPHLALRDEVGHQRPLDGVVQVAV